MSAAEVEVTPKLTVKGVGPWEDIEWRSAGQSLPEVEGGCDAGRILVRLQVDGSFTAVYADGLGSEGEVPALCAAVDALTKVRDALVDVYFGRRDA